MTRVSVDSKIYLEPHLLDEKIIQHIRDKVNENVGKCDPQYGYILKVYDNIQILNNLISRNEVGALVKVRYDIKTLKPEVGSTHEGKVCMIFAEGIFTEVFDKMKVLIPSESESLGKYKYDKEKNSFIKSKKTITIGSIVKIQVDVIKYEKNNFNCIGSLI